MHEDFGPYRLLSRIGSGASAETFVAEPLQESFVDRVCVKRLRPDAIDELGAQTFENEAKVATLLRHANVVKVYAVGEVDGRWWISMEWVDGIDLSMLLGHLRLRGEKVPQAIALHVVRELCAALVHAHERSDASGRSYGIVHRDIKPSNVLLGYDGAVKLTDFGVAKHAFSERTRTGQMKGTIPYMSPEQVNEGDLDPRSDVFSLGVLLFELLAGVRPYDGDTELRTRMNIAKCERTAKLPHGLTPGLRTLIGGMLEHDREQRPASARVVERFLEPRDPEARAALSVLVHAARPAAPVSPSGELTVVERPARRAD